MDNVKEKLDYYSENISKEICDMPMIDLKIVKQTVKTRIYFALKEILESQLSSTEQYRNSLKDEYLNQDVPNWRKEDIKRELVKINAEMKVLNLSISDVKNYTEYEKLKAFINNNYGKEVMTAFYSEINNPYNK